MNEIFRRQLTPLNIVFFLHVFVVGLIATGMVEREAAFALLAVVLFFLIFSPFEDTVLYTVRSLPFFIALPVTESFDSFNMWRVVIGVLFLRWIILQRKEAIAQLRTFNFKRFWKENQFEFLALCLFGLSFLSLLKAGDLSVSLKRIIYFGNMAALFPIVKGSILSNRMMPRRLMKNIIVSMGILVVISYLQLYTAFQWDYMKFVNFWALKVQYGFYGDAWSSIVYQANTWFAYLGGGGLRVRIFSTFPDSHSFPLYLLMACISFLSLAVGTKVIRKEERNSRGSMLFALLLILPIFFILILTGTRGVWVSVVFPIVLAFGLCAYRKIPHRRLAAFALASLLMFLLLLPLTSYVYSFPQFRPAREGQEDEAFLARLRSSINFSETSNNERIEIWMKTLVSFTKAPLLGVGIGNFPIVLDQDISLAKAGSSAHNLYLNVAAEIGFIGGVLFALAGALLLQYSFTIFAKSKDAELRLFGLFALLFLAWVFGYSLTDAALFDERAFLMFIVTSAMIVSGYVLTTQKQYEEPSTRLN